MNNKIKPIYSQDDSDHDQALEEFEARKESFYVKFQRSAPESRERDLKCDFEESEIDENIVVGETEMNERLAMIFRHNL